MERQERRTALEELDRWVAVFKRDDVPTESIFLDGEPVAAILEKGKSADLVVMGTHGRTGLSRFLMGSVAYGALKHTTAPMLVVPSPDHAWLLEHDEQEQPRQEPVPLHCP
jgi:nucleotide-binding universal stress UspA family protein